MKKKYHFFSVHNNVTYGFRLEKQANRVLHTPITKPQVHACQKKAFPRLQLLDARDALLYNENESVLYSELTMPVRGDEERLMDIVAYIVPLYFF